MLEYVEMSSAFFQMCSRRLCSGYARLRFKDVSGYVRDVLEYSWNAFGYVGLCSAMLALRLCARFCSDCTVGKFCPF